MWKQLKDILFFLSDLDQPFFLLALTSFSYSSMISSHDSFLAFMITLETSNSFWSLPASDSSSGLNWFMRKKTRQWINHSYTNIIFDYKNILQCLYIFLIFSNVCMGKCSFLKNITFSMWQIMYVSMHQIIPQDLINIF